MLDNTILPTIIGRSLMKFFKEYFFKIKINTQVWNDVFIFFVCWTIQFFNHNIASSVSKFLKKLF